MTRSRTASLFAGIAVAVLGSTAHARVVLPREGRFLSPDRAGMIDGPNQYIYAKANPVMYTDPYGDYAVFGTRLDIPPGETDWQPVPTRLHPDTGQLRLREVAEAAFDRAEGWLRRPGVDRILRKECRLVIHGGAVKDALDAIEIGAARPSKLFFFDARAARENGAAGASAELGSRPFKIAFGPSFQYRGQRYVGGPTTVPLDDLAVTFVHELLHHYLKYQHAAEFTETNDPLYRASKDIAKTAGYNPWGN